MSAVFFRRHPVATTVGALVVFLFWTLPQWLATLWPAFVRDKTIPEWLADKSWPGLTPAVFGWLSIAFFLVLAALVVFAVAVSRRSPAARTLSLEVSGPKTPRGVARELTRLREWAVVNLQNRAVASFGDQQQLDSDTNQWEKRVVSILEDHADPTDVSNFRMIGRYVPVPPLRPLVNVIGVPDPSTNQLAAQNVKHRNEIAERLDRLMEIARRLEQLGEPSQK